ncbi:Peptidyl-prolyl cis-trans isomerase cyp15 [Coemansia sp. RSA 2611]|nr:Peptidyl-prolyl cis-trans isomerase cyp15 [Coemansia sp. RSA 2611]
MSDTDSKRARSSDERLSDSDLTAADNPRISKRRAMAHASAQSQALDLLPNAQMYERSYMHRDSVDHVVVTATGFVITVSTDGHVKFWKKRDQGIEFAKDFRAHLRGIRACAVSLEGDLFATCSIDENDKTVKIFDVVNFDMIAIITADCVPSTLCWATDPVDQSICIMVADSARPVVYTYGPYASVEAKRTIETVHRQPVALMAYNPVLDCIVSTDNGGMVEYWPLDKPHELPQTVDFTLKSQTSLYEFKKSKCVPTSLTFSPDFELFACTSTGDSAVRVFRSSTGKLFRKYDESAGASNTIQHSDQSGRFKLDNMEFGRRLVVENELLKAPAGRTANAVFDQSSRFLLYPSLFGIKVVDIAGNKVVRVLGKPEPNRFVNIALCQSTPGQNGANLELAASANPGAKSASDPTLFCTAFKRNRFFMFTREEPDHTDQGADRDVFNERPTREEASLAVMPTKHQAAKSAAIRTTVGDIHVALYPEHAPKAVENFAALARNGYYNDVIFHRVIKGFMVQTGDPLGDGTGGESIWGRAFADEFTPQLRHDRPFTLSMANAGPNTNGSQFFITTVESAPWLDDKHTVFGRVTVGADIVRQIEQTKTDKQDKPLEDISILNIQVKSAES